MKSDLACPDCAGYFFEFGALFYASSTVKKSLDFGAKFKHYFQFSTC